MSGHGEDPERVEARRRRLRQEFDDEQLPFARDTEAPEALRGRWDEVVEVVADELVYARHIPVHEGYRPPYGCLIVASLSDEHVKATLHHEGHVEEDLDSFRKLVDGTNTMLYRDLEGQVAVVNVPDADELALVELTDRVNGVCVQRQASGDIKVFTRTRVTTNSGYAWTSRTMSSHVLLTTVSALQLPTQLVDSTPERLRALLDTCVHVLSPQGIGATIVWRLVEHNRQSLDAVANEPTPSPALLNMLNPNDRFQIATLLASVDGACMIDPDGKLELYEAMLDPSEQAKSVVAQDGGTRHTSAKRFSFDHPSTLVAVVSADGPVTIYSDGAAIAHQREESSGNEASWRLRLPLNEIAEVEVTEERLQCGTCEKELLVSIARSDRTDNQVRLPCPVCLTKDVAVLDHVVEATISAVKAWNERP